MSKFYTGIGSRETPDPVLELMGIYSIILYKHDYTVRSGHAEGADQAFEVLDRAEIYLPWNGFNGATIDKQTFFGYDERACEIAAKFHPKWSNLSDSARKFHSRNVHQVLGRDLNSPSEFVICWTKDGKASGGTGQAIRIANAYGVPVYNMKNGDDVTNFRIHILEKL